MCIKSHPLDCRENNKLEHCPVLLVVTIMWKTESDPVFFWTVAATLVPLSNASRGKISVSTGSKTQSTVCI